MGGAMSQFPAVIELSSLDGSNGFKISGVSAGDATGRSVSSAGDFNHDGYLDVIIGGVGAGMDYVVFGSASGFAANLDLASLNGANGFRLSATVSGAHLGRTVAAAGDVNADGIPDVILGAASSGSLNEAYVVFGAATGFGAAFDMSSLNGTNGFKITGLGGVALPVNPSVAGVGDVNGDGVSDVIVGSAYGGSIPNSGGTTGESFVIFGKAGGGFAASIDASTLNGSNGFKLTANGHYDDLGFSVSGAGDINGDGVADLIVGAPTASPGPPNSYAGISYVVFGKHGAFNPVVDLSVLNGTNGFKLSGTNYDDCSGVTVSSAGDINGDGFGDLVVGAIGPRVSPAGTGYIVFGKASGFAGNLNLSSLSGSDGFKMTGFAVGANGTYNHMWASDAGDMNGDGLADFVIGTYQDQPHGVRSGSAYVVFGKATGFSASLDVATLDGTNGFKINGVAAYDQTGISVRSAGDLNGDGLSDLIIGADSASPHGSGSGAAYVVYGRQPDSSVTRVGNTLAQTLVGGGLNDSLSGLGGDDRLYGHGGNDTLTGGTGSDTFLFAPGDGRDLITDFTAGGTDDSIDLSTYAHLGSFEQVLARAVQSGPDTLLKLDDEDQVTLSGVSKSALTSADFTLSAALSPDFGSGADFNGDGTGDVLWRNSTGLVALWSFAPGSAAISYSGIDTVGPSWHIQGAADFNGDGKADVLWRNDSGYTALWTSTPGGQYSYTGLGQVGLNWHVQASADFSGDGKADVLWRDDNGLTALWQSNPSNAALTYVGLDQVGLNWHVQATADFNGDGLADVLWRDDTGLVALWEANPGTSHMTYVGLNPVPLDWSILGAGDFNGDGKADILWRQDTGLVGLWQSSGGSSALTYVGLANVALSWHMQAIGDFNHDGKADVLWRNDSGQVAAWNSSPGGIVFQGLGVVGGSWFIS